MCFIRRVAVSIWIFSGLLWVAEGILLTRTVDHYAPVPVATVFAVFAGTITLLGGQVWSWGMMREAAAAVAIATPEAPSLEEPTVAITRVIPSVPMQRPVRAYASVRPYGGLVVETLPAGHPAREAAYLEALGEISEQILAARTDDPPEDGSRGGAKTVQ